MPARATPRPTGRDEVRAAVLDTASRHFAAHGTRASLRAIAADAGVNLGLIHRHIGNKDDLLRAVVAKQARAGTELVASAPDAATAMRRIFEESNRSDRHVRMLAWLLLEDDGTRGLQERYPTIAALRAMVGSEDEEIALLAAFAVVYGWTVFGPQLLAAFGYLSSERRHVEERVADLLVRIVSAAGTEPALTPAPTRPARPTPP